MKEFKIFKKSILIIILFCFYNGSYNLPASNVDSIPDYDNEIANIPFFVNSLKRNINVFIINPELYKINETRIIIRKKISSLYKIMTIGKMSCNELAVFLHSNNSEISILQAKNISKLYISESNKEGVNHDIAFSQMCLETGFLKFNGVVHPNQNNFCGLGTINIDNCGQKFNSKKEGIRAHIQHLKAYASDKSIKNALLDNRFYFVERGISPTVDNLSGRWASDPEYSNKIKSILDKLWRG
jgi:hypothetical protein